MKVLVVDDNKMERTLISMALKKNQYDIIEAVNGHEALAAINSHDISIVISDWVMPGMDGIELCRKIRLKKNRDGYVYIIMVTARSEKEDFMAGFEAGVDAYLYKPIDIKILDVHIKAGMRIIALEKELVQEKKKVSLYARQMEELARERAEQLVHADRMASLGIMAAGIAHEINNPATFISGNIQTFEKFWSVIMDTLDVTMKKKERFPVGEEQFKRVNFVIEEMPSIISAIKDGTQRIRRIVGGLKSYARQDKPSFALTDINKVVDDALLLCHNTLKNHVKTVIDIAPGLPRIFCDRHQIEQILVNLFNNAAYAMRIRVSGQGLLKISAFKDGESLKLTVEDNGTGLDSETLNKIWDPFYTTKPVGEGTGLGLSISQGIIKNHGGTLTAENSRNGGALFSITLPIGENI
ncbi:putative Response regulator receiver sensor signal transduction histidine kinase [Desulfamplus magnetovallimortis]|uniref:histidine kinase n=1 Tax=Desulfamplus magnetovallimortis TaxID=1246637 RepID=A0A1W1HI03_9BACT|nr:response regulator [Desulfamplus magnetovallimortis]SLM32076.1 putative Response regulator receiver sensor signal transduction histidine kinase [Desulfamplus magnetovallimortis]